MTDTTHPFTLIASGELEAWRMALPHLAADYLPELRARLRDARQWPHLTELLRLERATLLDACCRRLVAELEGWTESYLVGVGDMFPAAPDDVSEISA